jgi:DNA uptake protein ComE-like DNA-binding protein
MIPVSKWCLLILFVFSSFLAWAQKDSILQKTDGADLMLDIDTKEAIEMDSESNGTEDTDYTELTETRTKYLEKQLNLNTANRTELNSLDVLSDIQIAYLNEHIEKNGPLLSLMELQSIEGFDLQTIYKLLPYVSVGSGRRESPVTLRAELKRSEQVLRYRFSKVLEQQRGFSPIDKALLAKKPNARYLGTVPKVFVGYRLKAGQNISLGLTGKKDPGEEFFRGSQKQGFDFYSGHCFIQTEHAIRKAVVGDFSIAFGQGLLAWSGIALSKTADASRIKKNAVGLKPYTSSSENTFLRGAGCTVGKGPAEFSLFFSSKRMDANVSDTSSAGEVLQVRTLQTTGLHATKTEVENRKAIRQTIGGGNISYNSNHLNAGLTGMYTQFSAAIIPAPRPYNAFDFRGTALGNVSVYYDYRNRNFLLFGEAAASSTAFAENRKKGFAAVQGLVIALDPKLSFSVLIRHYDPGYHSFYSGGFSAGGKTANETGIFMGVLVKPSQHTTVSAFYDLYTHPWLKYRVNSPSDGADYFIQFSFQPDKKTTLYASMRHRQKALDPSRATAPALVVTPSSLSQGNYRIDISTQVFPFVQLHTRFEGIVADDSVSIQEKGELLSFSVLLHQIGKPVSFSLSYTLFDTPSGNTRIYAFENSLPGTFSVPAVSSRGTRCSALVRYKLSKQAEVWMSINRLFYDSKTVISAGTLNEIQGRHKTEFGFLLAFHF